MTSSVGNVDGGEWVAIRDDFIQKVASAQRFTGGAVVLWMKMARVISD